jgi:hypothetical protein
VTTKCARADPKAVADVNRFLKQAFRGEVLAENSPRKVYSRKFLAPGWVVLRWIRVNGFIDSSMHGQVRLLITLQVELRDSHPALHRFLEDRSANCLSLPLDFAR